MKARLVPALVAVASAALAAGWARGSLWPGMPAAAILGSAWLVGLWRRWTWVSGAGFAAYTVAAAIGVLLEGGVGWLLAGLALALAAWDLDAFTRRLASTQRIEDQPALERRHLLRLLAVELGGLTLAVVALVARLNLGFGLLLLLGLLGVVGLSRAVTVLT